jgi:regulatory protein
VLVADVGKITTLEIQKRNKERVNVYLDDEFAFALSLIEAARLHKGQTLSEAEIAALRGEDEVAKAVDRAVHFISYRPRSVQEVRRNLAEKGIAAEVIEAALARLSAMGYVDDTAFARFWLENRETFKPLSPVALRQELQQKGIARDVIDEVLSEVDAEDAAYRAALAQVRRIRTHDRREFKRKLGAFLQRRGFSFAVARTVIGRLMEELEAQTPNYFGVQVEQDFRDGDEA